MNKKKGNNPYATLSIKKITAKNKQKNEPCSAKIQGGDLRVKGGK